MPRTQAHNLVQELEAEARNAGSSDELMWLIVRRLQREFPRFDWVGFYMISPSDPNMLELGPFVGAPTPHTRIPLDQGICGAAAASGKTIIVDDVRSDPRYLACSLETRSEIVAPVFAHGRVAGELDIDSHTPAAFDSEDRKLVEQCAAMVGRYLEKARNKPA